MFLLTIANENKSHYVYVKDYNIFMCNKTKTWKNEKLIRHPFNMDLPHELPFYDELSIVKISQAFTRYARSYKIEIIDS